MTVRIVGQSERRVFGLEPGEYLRRHFVAAAPKASAAAPLTLVAGADMVATGPTLAWLAVHPKQVLMDADGRPAMGVVETEGADALARVIAEGSPPEDLGFSVAPDISVFVSNLRRMERVAVLDLRAGPPRLVERRIFDLVYKRVTDLVTRYVWPTPAFHAVRVLAAARVPPNAVTLLAMVLVVLATVWFLQGRWLAGFAAAWIMTFLDTVDGKLARVTGTSSVIGDILDHGTDWIHPPAWWICIALGLQKAAGGVSDHILTVSCVVILATYVAGRAGEAVFRRRFGFNQYVWRPFDSALRVVIARRNINLLILTIGLLVGRGDLAFVALAGWSVVSVSLQVVRSVQALVVERQGRPIQPWLS